MSCPSSMCGPYDLDLSCCLVSGAFPDPCTLNGEPVPQSLIDTSILAASQMLYVLTGRQFCCATVTLRPCRSCPDQQCCPDGGFDGDYPAYPVHQADGTWINQACTCADSCSCVNLSEVQLPYPTCSVNEVLIDGVIIDDTTYRVDDFSKLVRLGSDTFPQCNDLTKPTTEIGTWSVTLTYGRPVPQLVWLAAQELACQLIKGCVGQPCNLPQRLTSVTRQGVSLSFLDPQAFFTQGRTGIYLVDLAVMTYNPKLLQRKPTVYSPDVANKWRVTTWNPGDPTGCIPGVTEPVGVIDGGGP